MKIITVVLIATLVFSVLTADGQEKRFSPTMWKVSSYDLENASFVDAVAELTARLPALHLGLEEVLRESGPNQTSIDPKFSLHMRNATVAEVLDELCKNDSRYVWSVDGNTVNIFPGQSIGDRTYLLTQLVPEISFSELKSADDVLVPLVHIFPSEQMGYVQLGGEPSFSPPWSASFTNITVRQLMNRVTERLQPTGIWIFRGAKDQRFFTFYKGAIHTKS